MLKIIESRCMNLNVGKFWLPRVLFLHLKYKKISAKIIFKILKNLHHEIQIKSDQIYFHYFSLYTVQPCYKKHFSLLRPPPPPPPPYSRTPYKKAKPAIRKPAIRKLNK